MNEKRSSGLVSGLMDFLKMLDEIEKKGLTEKTVSGEKSIGSGKVKYDYNVRIGFLNPSRVPLGSKARTMPWKSRKATSIARITKVEEKEELVSVEEKDNFTVITVELPALEEKAVNCIIKNNKLKISAKTIEGTVEKEIQVPKESKITKTSFKNRVLEIWVKKKRKEEK